MVHSRYIVILYIFLLIHEIISQETNCVDITPQSASDCILSTADKENYEYCCYAKFSYGTGSCIPYNYDDYKNEKEYTFYDTFECNHIYSGCEDIKPNKASDCVLSEEDKRKNLAYCCYEVFDGEKECQAYNQKDYQEELEEFQVVKYFDENAVFDCGNNKSSSSFINISIMLLILIIINL